ncbi:hypothetical protein [Silanimonas sp.]|uniref:hypothetical protein n=1 Tax=Silanimonas sp. TaxID=1929290 RepID=UPI0022C05955|nr:hypothetical protein [Silanimonas sp.]MCZ8114989.1 hypothetical protein [Silanimonas sp.]
MKTLTEIETNEVAGGAVTVGLIIAGAGLLGGAINFAYNMGKDMAERDNDLSCPGP